MSDSAIDQYLKEIEVRLASRPARERAAIMDDMRAHLEEKVAEGVAAGLRREEAVEAALGAFGEPSEVTLPLADEGQALVRRRPPDETFRRTVKWVAAGLLLVAGVWATLLLVDSLMAEVSGPQPEKVYGKFSDHSELAGNGNQTETFVVPEFRDEVAIRIVVEADAGCVRIRLTDPDGNVVSDSGDSCTSGTQDLAFEGVGRWTVAYSFDQFRGRLSVEAWA